MNNVPPYSKMYDQNYENVSAICPFCDHKNIFNRATDLMDLTVIHDKRVQCFECQKTFRINGDIVNPAYDLLIFDCYKLKKEKRYSYCILNLAQSFEMFFALYFRVEILCKPLTNYEYAEALVLLEGA